jgi:hypothetical protein
VSGPTRHLDVPGPPPQSPAPRTALRTRRVALCSCWCGILPLLTLPLIAFIAPSQPVLWPMLIGIASGIAAIVLGTIGMRRSEALTDERSLATFGLVLGLLGIVISVLGAFFLWVTRDVVNQLNTPGFA